MTGFAFIAITLVLISTDATAARKQSPTNQVSQALKQAGLKELENEVTRQLGQAIEVGAPLRLDHRTAYPPTTVPIDYFQPKKLELTPENTNQPLEPGDYTIDVIGYCTKWSLHYPGRGLAYKLAPLQGRAAPAVSALIWRGNLRGIPPRRLNAMAWRIQGGVPISQWRPEEREFVRQLIPEYEADLDGDFLYQTRQLYDTAAKVGKLPKYEAMLAGMGPPGETLLELQRARKILANKTLSAERMPDLLYGRRRDGLPRTLEAGPNEPPSPWSEILPGVFARVRIVYGNMGRNVLDLRITPPARIPSSSEHSNNRHGATVIPAAASISEKLPPGSYNCDEHPGLCDGFPPPEEPNDPVYKTLRTLSDLYFYIWRLGLMGYPEGRPAQALILVPSCPHPGTFNCGWGEIGIRG